MKARYEQPRPFNERFPALCCWQRTVLDDHSRSALERAAAWEVLQLLHELEGNGGLAMIAAANAYAAVMSFGAGEIR